MVISVRRLGRRLAIHEAAAAAGTADTLAGLAETGTTLADGTELFVGRIAFAAEGPAFALPPDDGDRPDLNRHNVDLRL